MSDVKETTKPAWLVRAEAEQKELFGRMAKLDAAIWGEEKKVRAGISHLDLCDLIDQSRAMAIYNSALSRRIKRNGGTVCE